MENRTATRQASRPSNEECQWVQVSLARAQLLSIRFAQEIYTHAVSGTHWISTDGVDLSLAPGERVKLPAGRALIDGEGIVQIAPVTSLAAAPPNIEFRPWRLPSIFKRRALALHININ